MAESTQKPLLGLARTLERVLGFPEGRLSCMGDTDTGIPGKAALIIEGNPTLSQDELAKVHAVVATLNHALGGDPMITSKGSA